MADVFIAYSKLDQEKAQNISNFLESVGLSVWWDTSLLPGDRFVEVIDRELSSAKIVLVLWSQSSIRSRWVYSEAHAAQRSNKLLPLIIDDIINFDDIPMLFAGISTLDFGRKIDFILLEKAI